MSYYPNACPESIMRLLRSEDEEMKRRGAELAEAWMQTGAGGKIRYGDIAMLGADGSIIVLRERDIRRAGAVHDR